MRSVDIPIIQKYTIPYRKPTVIHGNISKRQVASLPNFTCHCHSARHDAIFAGQFNGNVIRWNVAREVNGVEVSKYITIGKHEGGVTCIVEHQKYIFTGSSDTSIKVWDVGLHTEVGIRCVQKIPAHDATVTALASHCNCIISVSCDCTLKVWRAEDGREGLASPWYVAKQMFVFETWATCLYAPNRKIAEDSQCEIFVGDANGGVTMLRSIAKHLDADTFLVSRLELVRYNPSVRSQGIIKVLPVTALNVVMTLSYDDVVRLSDITTNHVLVNIRNPNAGARFVDFTWDTHHEELMLVDQQANMLLWDSKTNKILGSGKCSLQPSGIAYISSSRAVVVTADSVCVLEVQRCVPSLRQTAHQGRVIAVRKCPSMTGEEDLIVTCGADNVIHMWQVEEKLIPLVTFRPSSKDESEVASLDILALAEIIVTGHDDGTMRVRSRHVAHTRVITAHTNTVTAITHGKWRYMKGCLVEAHHIVTISFDGYLAVWEVFIPPGQENFWSVRPDTRVRCSNSELLSVVVDDLKHVYIVGDNEGDVTFWSVNDLTCTRTLRGPVKNVHGVFSAHKEGVMCLALDGNMLFSAGEDERICMWDTITGALIHVNDSYTSDANHLVIVPDNGNLVSCLRDGSIHVWSQSSKEDVATFESENELTSILSMREPLDLVMAGTEDGAILRVHLPLGNTARGKSGVAAGTVEALLFEGFVHDDADGEATEGAEHSKGWEHSIEEAKSPGEFSKGSEGDFSIHEDIVEDT